MKKNCDPGVDPTKLFFLRIFFFGIKLGHFTINKFFLYVTKTQAYQQKTEKFFVCEEKKFGRIDSRDSDLKICLLPGLEDQKVEKHWDRQ